MSRDDLAIWIATLLGVSFFIFVIIFSGVAAALTLRFGFVFVIAATILACLGFILLAYKLTSRGQK